MKNVRVYPNDNILLDNGMDMCIACVCTCIVYIVYGLCMMNVHDVEFHYGILMVSCMLASPYHLHTPH